MPGKQNSKPIEFQGFVQIELSDEDIGEVIALSTKPNELMHNIMSAIDDDYKFQISVVENNGTVKATLMDIQRGRTSVGWMLSGEAPSANQAIASLMCKHLKHMNSNWVPFLVSSRNTNGIR